MIEYKNVALRYDAKLVLKDVNLTINDGEFMVLVGPSGSGKTTMLKMINQLIEPTDGNIYLNEKRIKEHNQRKLRLEIGYVLQQIALFPNLTVAENIALIPEMKGWKKEQIAAKTKELLDKVALPFDDYAKRLPSELSGGEQQMLAMGRALMSRPKLLLLDEPSMGLAPIFIREIFKIIQEIQKTGTTVLLIEQNAKMALSISNRAYVLETGSVVLSGTGQELLESDEIQKAYLGG